MNGTSGASVLALTNNAITLRGTRAKLDLGLDAGPSYATVANSPDLVLTATGLSGPGGNLVFSGNSFVDTAGDGTLNLTDVRAGAITVDVARGRLTIGGSQGASFSGFSSFTTAAYNNGNGTLFLDGSGAQSYSLTARTSTQTPEFYTIARPAGGRVVFAPGHGADSVSGLLGTSSTVGGVIELKGFGAMNGVAQVKAAATAAGSGITIATPDGGSISLAGVTVADLTDAMFAFTAGSAGAAAQDYNGDGRSDLVLQNAPSPPATCWPMSAPAGRWRGPPTTTATGRPTCCCTTTTAAWSCSTPTAPR